MERKKIGESEREVEEQYMKKCNKKNGTNKPFL